ncbi:hypothetical protein ACLMJK_001358 [Lecanora helva]
MFFTSETGRGMERETIKEVNCFFNGEIMEDYALDLSRREKPVLSIDDLLLVLHQLWALDEEVFPDERQRVQLGALLLTAAYTACRPSSLVYSAKAGEARGTKEAIEEQQEFCKTLCYKHITVLLLRNDDAWERDIMVMEVDLTQMKGDSADPKPKKFVFHEHQLLAFCPIAHILAFAFADNAFEPQMAQQVGSLFHAQVRPDRFSMQIPFKPSMRDVSIFRQASRTTMGPRTSPDRALRYHTFNNCLQRLGRDTGFQQILTAYCVRRGCGNALDGVATEAVRNQVMGHQNSQTFQFYLNERVKFDVQSAVLGSPSKQALINALGGMRWTLDRRAPTNLSIEQRASLRNNKEIADLCEARDSLAKCIKLHYKTIPDAKGTETLEAYMKARSTLAAAKRRISAAALRKAREDYFSTVDTKDLNEQFSQLSPDALASQTNPALSVEERLRVRPPRSELLPVRKPRYTLGERSRLAELLFEDATNLSSTELLSRRIEAISNMAALCHRREVKKKPRPRVPKTSPPTPKPEIPTPLNLSIICPDTQCIFCLGDEALPPATRVRHFARASAARRHIRQQHLRMLGEGQAVRCPHPLCRQLQAFEGLRRFKVHAARVHKVEL